MKFATIASLCLAASVGTQAASFDNLMSLLAQAQEEAAALSLSHNAKDQEITSLISQLAACKRGASDDDTADEEVNPAPSSTEEATTETTSSEEEEVDTPAPQTPTTPEPTAAATEEAEEDDDDEDEEEESAPVPTSSFKFARGQSWNYNLDSPVNTDVDVDVFFIDMGVGQAAIDDLHEKGKGVVCYISIGTVEDWRSDKDDFPSEAVGGDVRGWAGERWLDVNNADVRNVMVARVQAAKSMSCDGVEPDNMMVYSEPGTGVDVSEADQIDYNAWFAGEVHAAGMSVGLKNTVELVPILVNDFDFAINEECHEWEECDIYEDTFLAEGKPVFNVEYNFGKSVCDEANALGLDTILKNYDLKADFCSCSDPSRDLDCMH